ncbi:hypothetical protein CLV33_1043 [Jejuia pallidilutea]|uniref:Fibronectin type-III domain-containing protein n=1 Tax=Jejuia pallidilutea TaxID=504487 RepID=A0A362X0A1_9FLAO|nr:hypothetical protein [Jejuia pallidilutea]PQV48798.1 hypothetical protein CLV33_1043 [Jejuia pallidilutea]
MTSCDDIIEVVDISESTVGVLAPKNDVTLKEGEINFTWTAVDDTETYRLQIATPNFENAQQIVTDSTLTATMFTKMLSTGNYQWRVRAENSDYNTVFATNTFTIEE